jgi:hypothetical protein
MGKNSDTVNPSTSNKIHDGNNERPRGPVPAC